MYIYRTESKIQYFRQVLSNNRIRPCQIQILRGRLRKAEALRQLRASQLYDSVTLQSAKEQCAWHYPKNILCFSIKKKNFFWFLLCA
jgi:hypothetical protein